MVNRIHEMVNIAYARAEAARIRLDEAIVTWGEDPTETNDIALTVCDMELESELQNLEAMKNLFYNWRNYR